MRKTQIFLLISILISGSLSAISVPISHIDELVLEHELKVETKSQTLRTLAQTSDYKVERKYIEGQTQIVELTYKGSEELYSNSKVIRKLKMFITFHPNKAFRIRIIDAESQRWEIPEKEPFPYFKDKNLINPENGPCDIIINEDSFSLKIVRKDNQEVIFDTTGRTFIYTDLYIEFGGYVPSDNIFGYGERFSRFKLDRGTFTIFARDEPMVFDRGEGGGNVYGHHPVGLVRDQKGKFFLMVMKNSNPMDIVIENAAKKALTHKIVGGVIDLHFFIGDEYPDTVLVNYHDFIGKFVMMPFWSMGYHQCRWGYHSVNRLRDILAKFKEFQLPIDTIWSDIDYMIDKEDFTINSAFPPSQMHSLFEDFNVHYVPIIDAGIKQSGYGAEQGRNKGVFLKNQDGRYFSGSVWPGPVYFVDFFHPNAEKYWIDMLDYTYEKIHYSGIWLDMNEIANFENGEQNRYSRFDSLPYTPGYRVLRTKTISMESVHYEGILELNVHDLHSILQNKATYNALKKRTPLPFILTRSSSFGTGQYSAHWTGDNGSGWNFLKISIAGNFNFQIFGQPFVGADICGFMGNANAELCARWIQLGALYPFARNHNQDISSDQEPWVFEYHGSMGANVLPTYRAALEFRYSILKHFYTQFILARGAGSIWKPLFFEFPNEEAIYKSDYLEREFMIGKGLLFIPATEAYLTEQLSYFPRARWFNFFNGKEVINENAEVRELMVQMPYNSAAPTFIRGGYILATQNILEVQRTSDLNDEFYLTVAFSEEKNGKWESRGNLMGISAFTDDEVYNRCVKKDCIIDTLATIDRNNKGLSNIIVQFSSKSGEKLDEIGVLGITLLGVPLSLSENKSNLEYVVVELYDKNNERKSESMNLPVVSLSENSVEFQFEDTVVISSGDFFKIQLLL